MGKNKKVMMGAVVASSAVFIAGVTTIAVVATRDDNKTGLSKDQNTKLDVNKEILNRLTEKQINDAIKAKEAFDSNMVPSAYKFPKEVEVSIDNKQIKVRLEAKKIDDAKGAIIWDAIASISTTTQAKSGSLQGFSTTVEKNEALTVDALNKITVQDIEDAAKKLGHLTPFGQDGLQKDQIDPSLIPTQTELTIIKDKIGVDVMLTNNSIDLVHGVIGWKAVLSSNGTTKTRNLSGVTKGFWFDSIKIIEAKINKNPRALSKQNEVGNKIISGTTLADFGLSPKALGIDSFNSISNFKIEYDGYDFAQSVVKATLTFDVAKAAIDGTSKPATVKLSISGFGKAKVAPKDPTKVADKEFQDMVLPDNFVIPNTVTSFGARSFRGAKLNDSFKIPNSVTWLGGETFREAKLNDSFQIPDSVTTIKGRAFESVTLPQGFKYPKALEKTITDSVFYKTVLPKNFKIPNTVTKMEDFIFAGATLPEGFEVPPTNNNRESGFENLTLPKGHHILVATGVTYTQDEWNKLDGFTMWRHVLRFGWKVVPDKKPAPTPKPDSSSYTMQAEKSVILDPKDNYLPKRKSV